MQKTGQDLAIKIQKQTMYAIAFDLDTDKLKEAYHNPSYNNGYTDIGNILKDHGFSWQQQSVYFGDPAKINAVTCVMAIMDVTAKCPWFSKCVKDIRMLRIEDNNDLMPAVHRAAPQPSLKSVG